jgi:hypothetical protein
MIHYIKILYIFELCNLRLLPQIPKDGAKEYSGDKSECHSDKVVVWTPPIRPPLFPKACCYLCEKWL